jgi:Ca-dependent carbohydrate-binding module xylan-binding
MRHTNLKALVLAVALVALAAPQAAGAAPCKPITSGERCEGENMTIDPNVGRTVWGLNTTVTSDGGLMMLTRGGTATITDDLPYSDRLVVRARGGQYCKGWPSMTLTVDGREVMSTTVEQLGWKSFTIPTTVTAGSHELAIGYHNDYAEPGCDRNLRIDYIDARRPGVTTSTRRPRFFSAQSPWNIPAALKGPEGSGNPYASQFTSYAPELEISGLPGNPDYAKPTFFAQASDPATANVNLTTDWSPTRDLRWDRGPIPVPAGAYPAPGTDGHMTIVSADRTRAWEFWRCTSVSSSGITAAVVAQWDLKGLGYSAYQGENSARGSGTPLITTTLTAEETINGIDHALGITVPSVSRSYLYPVATKSDGSGGEEAVRYGMLFVLRSDYPVPATAGVGERNIIQALKTYGAYVVDQGASFELDASSTDAARWTQTGLRISTLSIKPTDMRLVSTL